MNLASFHLGGWLVMCNNGQETRAARAPSPQTMLNACRLIGAVALLAAATSTANLPLALVLTASGLGLGATLPAD